MKKKMLLMNLGTVPKFIIFRVSCHNHRINDSTDIPRLVGGMSKNWIYTAIVTEKLSEPILRGGHNLYRFFARCRLFSMGSVSNGR